jgi:hypothetical protein
MTIICKDLIKLKKDKLYCYNPKCSKSFSRVLDQDVFHFDCKNWIENGS